MSISPEVIDSILFALTGNGKKEISARIQLSRSKRNKIVEFSKKNDNEKFLPSQWMALLFCYCANVHLNRHTRCTLWLCAPLRQHAFFSSNADYNQLQSHIVKFQSEIVWKYFHCPFFVSGVKIVVSFSQHFISSHPQYG